MLQHAVFVLSGVIGTMGYQWIFYQGASGGGFSMLTVLPSYIGMILPLLRPSTRKSFGAAEHQIRGHKLIICASLCDILGSLLTDIGLFYTGSGIYQVIYSSVIVFTAVMSRIFLQTPISRMQWISVLLVNVGLGLSAGFSALLEDTGSLVMGTLFILCGTVALAAACVIDQKVINDQLMDGNNLCYYTGCYSSIFTLLYISGYTLPRFKELIYVEVLSAHGDWILIAAAFVFLCFINVVHNNAYFTILEEYGSVTAGILQAFRAVVVFFVSSLLFCSSHGEQCLTNSRVFSSIIVLGSVVMFLLNPPKATGLQLDQQV